MIQGDLFGSEPSPEQRRDRALKQVRENSGEWFELALLRISAISPDWSGIGEDVRAIVIATIGRPHDPHAWGALISAAVRRKLLIPTGHFRKMKAPTSNARKSEVYRRA